VVRLDLKTPGLGNVQHVADYLSDGTVIRLSGHPFVAYAGGEVPGTFEINKP
jgi:hypothetical protein